MASIISVDNIRATSTSTNAITIDSSNNLGDITMNAEGGTGTLSVRQGVAKVWVNFDGSVTLSADDSFNLSSLTDNGTGDHTVTATNIFNNRNYAVSGSAAFQDGLGNYTNSMRVLSINSYTSPTTSALRINTSYSNSNNEDCDIVTPVIHGDLA